MSESKFENAKKQVGSGIKYYNEYMDLSENLFSKIKNNEDYNEIKIGLTKLKLLKRQILKQITDILYKKGLEVDLFSEGNGIENGLGMLVSFTLDDMYFNSNQLPNSVNEKLKDEFYDDCFEAYLVLCDLVKKGKIQKENIYEGLFSSFSYKYDLIIDIYKESGVEACIKYLKILSLFKNNFKTTVYGIIDDERYKKYILYLTGKNSLLSGLDVYDLYLILLNFNSDAFLDIVVETNGKILDNIANVILKRKKEGLTKEDEMNQLKILSKNINVIPESNDVTIKL